MIERRILLQETSQGPRFVSTEATCSACPAMCFGSADSAATLKGEGTPAILAVNGATLNSAALRLFAAPLAALVAATVLLDAVTNAYPLLQELPLQLSILALFGALLMGWSRILRGRWFINDDGLKELYSGPTITGMPKHTSGRRVIVSERSGLRRV